MVIAVDVSLVREGNSGILNFPVKNADSMPEEIPEITTPQAQQVPESTAETIPEEQKRQLGSSGYAEPEIKPASTNAEETIGEYQVGETNTGNINLFPPRRSARIPTARVGQIPGALKSV